jgi:hypothetical protein
MKESNLFQVYTDTENSGEAGSNSGPRHIEAEAVPAIFLHLAELYSTKHVEVYLAEDHDALSLLLHSCEVAAKIYDSLSLDATDATDATSTETSSESSESVSSVSSVSGLGSDGLVGWHEELNELSLTDLAASPGIARYQAGDHGDFTERFAPLPPDLNPIDQNLQDPAMLEAGEGGQMHMQVILILRLSLTLNSLYCWHLISCGVEYYTDLIFFNHTL